MLNAKTACVALIFALGATSLAAAQDTVIQIKAPVHHITRHQAPTYENRSVYVDPPAVSSSPVPNSQNFLGYDGTNLPGR
jgi:hypothetical protein